MSPCHDDRFYSIDEWLRSVKEEYLTGIEQPPSALSQAVRRIAQLVDEREEAAYRHGLGDRAKVLEENRLLAAMVAQLTDRHHPGNIRP